MALSQTRQGLLFAFVAYFIWGITPAYFKLIDSVSSYEIAAHRAIWSVVFMLLLISATRHWSHIRHTYRNNKHFLLLFVSAMLIGGNWLLFIWAVNNNHMLETSMGYFITPLANMIFGMIFFNERFRVKQWIALVLAACAVLVQFIEFGTIPVIGLTLAFTFSLYGLVRKKISIDAQVGMLVETLTLFPFAIAYLFYFANTATSNLALNPLSLNILLGLAGAITTIPLLFFSAAASRLSLSSLGFFQYISPFLTFLLAVFVYGENVNIYVLITFAFIWAALTVFVWDAISVHKKTR